MAAAEFFGQWLYRDPGAEDLLVQADAPRYAHSGTTLFHYLIALDPHDPGDVLNAQEALAELLRSKGIGFTASRQAADDHALLLAIQPRWLDADTAYLASLVATAPAHLAGRERRAWLKARVLELFRYRKQPPRWLQSPAWPIGANGPLVFLGQLGMDAHDTAAVYVFHDPATGELRNVVQAT